MLINKKIFCLCATKRGVGFFGWLFVACQKYLSRIEFSHFFPQKVLQFMPNGKQPKPKSMPSVGNSKPTTVSSKYIDNAASTSAESGVRKAKGTYSQARWWLFTVPFAKWKVPDTLPPGITYLRGQQEVGESGDIPIVGVEPCSLGSTSSITPGPQSDGYHHWQFVAHFAKPIRLGGVRKLFGPYHAEPCLSKAALTYVWKDATSVPGSRFELGNKPVERSAAKDWDKVWDDAKAGSLQTIPADIRIRSYHTLKRIAKDYCQAPFREGIKVFVYWGATATGKSHRMFEESYSGGIIPYVKASTTKWWDGYQGQERVIIDEFRGQISIEHVLKWFDKYPCYVEEKGGQVALKANEFWICSNLHPEQWYPTMDIESKAALLRRLTITHFQDPFSVLIKKLAKDVERDPNPNK